MHTLSATDVKHHLQEFGRQNYEQLNISPTKPPYLGEEALPLWSMPPLMPSHLGAFSLKNPSVAVPYYAPLSFDHENILIYSNGVDLKNEGKGDEGVESFDEIGAIDFRVEVGGAKEDGASE